MGYMYMYVELVKIKVKKRHLFTKHDITIYHDKDSCLPQSTIPRFIPFLEYQNDIVVQVQDK